MSDHFDQDPLDGDALKFLLDLVDKTDSDYNDGRGDQGRVEDASGSPGLQRADQLVIDAALWLFSDAPSWVLRALYGHWPAALAGYLLADLFGPWRSRV